MQIEDLQTWLYMMNGGRSYRLLFRTLAECVICGDGLSVATRLNTLERMLGASATLRFARDMAERDGLAGMAPGDRCYVLDASADPAIDEGGCMYMWLPEGRWTRITSVNELDPARLAGAGLGVDADSRLYVDWRKMPESAVRAIIAEMAGNGVGLDAEGRFYIDLEGVDNAKLAQKIGLLLGDGLKEAGGLLRVKLSSAADSDAEDTAATSLAVKTVYGLADKKAAGTAANALEQAEKAQSGADAAKLAADNAQIGADNALAAAKKAQNDADTASNAFALANETLQAAAEKLTAHEKAIKANAAAIAEAQNSINNNQKALENNTLAIEANRAAIENLDIPDIAPFEKRLDALEAIEPPDMTPLENRLTAVENRKCPDLSGFETRLEQLENGGSVDLTEIEGRIAANEEAIANINIPDVSGLVQKTGDVMTGDLDMTGSFNGEYMDNTAGHPEGSTRAITYSLYDNRDTAADRWGFAEIYGQRHNYNQSSLNFKVWHGDYLNDTKTNEASATLWISADGKYSGFEVPTPVAVDGLSTNPYKKCAVNVEFLADELTKYLPLKGGTLTGALNINKAGGNLRISHPRMVKGTTPSSHQQSNIFFFDKSDNIIAQVGVGYNPNGHLYSGLYAWDFDKGLSDSASGCIGFDATADGVRAICDITPPRGDNSNSIANTAFVRDTLINNEYGYYVIKANNGYTSVNPEFSLPVEQWLPYYGFTDQNGSLCAALRYGVMADKTHSLQLMLKSLNDNTWNPGYFSLQRDAAGTVTTSITNPRLNGGATAQILTIKNAFASLNIQSSTMLANTGNTAGNNGNDQIGMNFKDKNGTLIGDILRVTGASGFEQLLLRLFCNESSGTQRTPGLSICFNRAMNYAYMTGLEPQSSANDATLPTCLWVNNRITAVTGKSAAASAMLIAASAAPADIVEDALACVKEAAKGAICHGFRFPIEGSEYHFTYDLFDQQNIADAFALAQAGENACLFARAESGEMVELALGPEVMKQLFAHAVNGHKNFYMRQCLERKQALAAAQSGEAIESLLRQWDLWPEYDERRKQRLIAAEMAASAPGQTPDAPADLPEFPEPEFTAETEMTEN